MEFIQAIEAKGKNLPQQVVCLSRGNAAFTLTQLHGETTVTSPYPPDHPPYKGLLTFTKDDSPFFFGRDGMIQQLLDKLSTSRFVPLLGASGSGKSSLVLAGLLPKLAESDWQVLVMRPTTQPLQNLRDTLVRGFPDAQVGTLASGADLQREVLRLVTSGKRLLLVIDQFEEVFTECRDDAARAAFFACLLEALDGDNPLHLVLTLRADFLGHCTEQAYAGLGQRLQHHALLLVAPTAGELREAITRPLALVGMRCEQALEDELVDQTLHAKGSLPLLQYVLEKLWQSARQERSRELTRAMYQQLSGQHGGGLRGVLNEKADAFYQQLEPQQQRLMEWLMVELVQVNDGQEDTRRTVTLQELHNRQPQYTAALDALLAQLVTHERLLTQDHDDHGQATITVANEALIRDWQQLSNWLDYNRELKKWRVRLKPYVDIWQDQNTILLDDKLINEAESMVLRHRDSLLLGIKERDFINSAINKRKEYRLKEERKKLLLKTLKVLVVVSLVGFYFIRTFNWAVDDDRIRNRLFNKKINDIWPSYVKANTIPYDFSTNIDKTDIDEETQSLLRKKLEWISSSSYENNPQFTNDHPIFFELVKLGISSKDNINIFQADLAMLLHKDGSYQKIDYQHAPDLEKIQAVLNEVKNFSKKIPFINTNCKNKNNHPFWNDDEIFNCDLDSIEIDVFAVKYLDWCKKEYGYTSLESCLSLFSDEIRIYLTESLHISKRAFYINFKRLYWLGKMINFFLEGNSVFEEKTLSVYIKHLLKDNNEEYILVTFGYQVGDCGSGGCSTSSFVVKKNISNLNIVFISEDEDYFQLVKDNESDLIFGFNTGNIGIDTQVYDINLYTCKKICYLSYSQSLTKTLYGGSKFTSILTY